MKIGELVNNVLQWGSDRQILAGDHGNAQSNPLAQCDKLSEELNETISAISKSLALIEIQEDLENEIFAKNIQSQILDHSKEVIDGLGDMMVVLIILHGLLEVSPEETLQFAWDEIKDRKGKMINGKFIKESDLQ